MLANDGLQFNTHVVLSADTNKLLQSEAQMYSASVNK